MTIDNASLQGATLLVLTGAQRALLLTLRIQVFNERKIAPVEFGRALHVGNLA
ncbi:hypothetical protein D3C85_1342660 [compost metagenome]